MITAAFFAVAMMSVPATALADDTTTDTTVVEPSYTVADPLDKVTVVGDPRVPNSVASTSATGRRCWSGRWRVTFTEWLTPWIHAYWGLAATWCSTSPTSGHIDYYRQYHFTEHLGGTLSDDGIKEDVGWYYTFDGKYHGGHFAHVKGQLSNCIPVGGCIYKHPWINLWVHRSGTTTVTKGGAN